jgi:hypothetical protein
MKNYKKKFITSILTIDLIIKALLMGVLQAFFAFFTKKKLEDWEKSKSKKS